MPSHNSSGTPVKKVPIHLQSAQNRILIKGGRIVNDDQMLDGDVYIEDGIIRQVGRDLTIPGGTRTIDARGKLIIPGGIDPNTHLEAEVMNARSVDDFYHGTRAALAGGTTMIVDFAVAKKGQSLLDAYEKLRTSADGKVCCDYGVHVAVPTWSQDVSNEMEALTKEKGVNSFSVYMAFELRVHDDEMLRILQRCAELGSVAMVHAENGDAIEVNVQKLLACGVTGPEGHEQSRPEEVEAEAAYRAIMLANQVNCPLYVMHVTGRKAAEVVCQKRQDGCIVFGETMAAALGTDGTHSYNKCWRHAAAHVTSPPLRPDPATPTHLMNMLSSGTLQTTASNNCTFAGSQKALGRDDFSKIPTGVNGLEDRMSIIWERGVMAGKLDACQFVAVTSTNAAKLFNIYPRKGRVAVGSDADVVIWDPRARKTISAKTHQHNVDFNVFEGMECHGVAEYVITNGRVVVDEGQVHVTQGAGRFVATPTFPPYVYLKVQEREAVDLPTKVEREPYTGAALPLPQPLHPNGSQMQRSLSESPFSAQQVGEFHARPPTRGGSRNLQDSSFSLSGAQIDDTQGQRAGIRVQNPPGGRSSGLW